MAIYSHKLEFCLELDRDLEWRCKFVALSPYTWSSQSENICNHGGLGGRYRREKAMESNPERHHCSEYMK